MTAGKERRGKLVARMMVANGMTVEALARETEVDPDKILQFITTEATLTREEWEVIRDTLGLNVTPRQPTPKPGDIQ